MTTLLIKKYKLKKKLKWKTKKKLKMIWMPWKEPWGTKKIKNFSLFNKKLAIFLKNKKKFSLLTWLQSSKMPNCLLRRVNWFLKFKVLVLWIMMWIHTLTNSKVSLRRKWRCTLYWRRKCRISKNTLKKRTRSGTRWKKLFIIEPFMNIFIDFFFYFH